MPTLTVTARGKVTFQKDVLQHLGIQPGKKLELEPLPDHQAAPRARRRTGTIDDFIGIPAGKTSRVATLEEISDPAAKGWPGLSA